MILHISLDLSYRRLNASLAPKLWCEIVLDSLICASTDCRKTRERESSRARKESVFNEWLG